MVQAVLCKEFEIDPPFDMQQVVQELLSCTPEKPTLKEAGSKRKQMQEILPEDDTAPAEEAEHEQPTDKRKGRTTQRSRRARAVASPSPELSADSQMGVMTSIISIMFITESLPLQLLTCTLQLIYLTDIYIYSYLGVTTD